MSNKHSETERSTPVPETGALRNTHEGNVSVFIHGSAGLTQEDAHALDAPLARFSTKLRKAANKLKEGDVSEGKK